MNNSLQHAIQKKYNMLGIEPEIPDIPMPAGLPAPAWVHQGPLYEIFVRNFSPAGNFAGVRQKLDYLKDLGIKTIWLMPIQPIGKSRRKGSAGSPYAISDHRTIHPDYGTEKDFRQLVDAVHDYDMRVIIDMVLNHGAPDHVLTKQEPAFLYSDSVRSPAEWSDVIDFNYEHTATHAYAQDTMTYWLREFDVDGFRCDVAGLVPLDFWEKASHNLREIKADLFLLAEWDARRLLYHAFHAGYDWTMYLIMCEVHSGKRAASDLMNWYLQAKETYPANAAHLRFTENHDLPRTIRQFGKNDYLPYLAFLMLTDGIPLINNGQEMGAENELSLFEKSTIDWQHCDEEVCAHYKKLIRIRDNYAAVFTQKIEKIVNDQPDQVVSYQVQDTKTHLVVVLNFSNEAREVKLKSDILHHAAVMDLINDQHITVKDNLVHVARSQALVFKM
jgi:glycosidase